jgi:hypothetical protein
MAASWGRGRTSRGAEAGHPFLGANVCYSPPLLLQAARSSGLLLRIFKNPAPDLNLRLCVAVVRRSQLVPLTTLESAFDRKIRLVRSTSERILARMALPFDPARLAVGAAVQRSARIGRALESGAHVCAIHGPLKTAHGRKCPCCGPPWFRHVRWDPTATPPAEPLRPVPVLDSPPRTAPDPAQMALALAGLNEYLRLAHAHALGCRDGPGTTPTLETALEEAGQERLPQPNAPAATPQRLTGRRRDKRGRYLAEPHEPTVALHPDERMTQEAVYAGIRALWHQLPHGSRKGLARVLGLPTATVRGIAKGRAGLKPRVLRTEVPGRSPITEAGLPEATRRRCSLVLNQIERGELKAVKTTQRWPNGTLRYVWKRHPPRPNASEGEGDAGLTA